MTNRKLVVGLVGAIGAGGLLATSAIAQIGYGSIAEYIQSGNLHPDTVAAMAEDEEEYQYVPSQLLPTWWDQMPEEPNTGSFTQDFLETRAAIAAFRDPEIAFACDLRPCTLYGDFDGDGKRDRATIVHELANYKSGILVQLRERDPILLAAGREFDRLGDDLVWADAWQVLEGTPNRIRLWTEDESHEPVTLVWTGSEFKAE